ncbi:MAG TPA: BMP family ABC transporter substrate-binding protein [Gemmatimonas aurantiaca]|uniref:BMP family ABC transporter substrate-binding protein n=2 Tax=Gemmatimonas aurantiaca TaxID=173480 RepID=A0A3D4V597_9BACT|nr:BMP family ABC transporter substrate-binding protein [Gemmatimonas aurantiaca]BAH37472.1 putative lipoprotein [Gemmatimonas aurantiaca T-27]HCT55888.1 BMP family ABC transporter substrate-binding protein [Gemmatimonas aurantiaca]
MRRTLFLIGALLLAHLALLTVRPSGATVADTSEGLDVGIVFDVGGRGDKSFNDGAYLGGMRAAKELGARVTYIEPGDGSDREAGLRLLAAEGMDIVIGVGFIFTDDILPLAKEYPNVRFADVDLSLPTDANGNPLPLPSNLKALKFREEEGSFLVGALAALVGKSKKVGFVGGMDIALIHKFEAGYKAGVQHVCPDCEVIVNYAGVTPEAFRNPGRGKEMALSMYNQGANVIFHASGSTGLGVFEAARTAGKLAIGVDADQYSEAPGFVLTSMVKGIDESVYQAVKAVKEGHFTGGVQQFGLAEKGVGYVYDDNNKALIPDSVRVTLDSLTAKIIDGRITVPSTRGGR